MTAGPARFFCPAVTPFDADGTLDVEAAKAVYDHLLAGGIDGIVVMGSTGEFFAMTDAQKRELIDVATAHCAGRTEVIVGTACLRVDETIDLSNYALDRGADAVMIVSPYYFALSDESIEAFYGEIAAAVHGDIYLYNFPARTGYDLSPAVVTRLLRTHPNIVGYKDTVLEVGHTRQLLTDVLPQFPRFRVFAGFDEWAEQVVTSGGAGVIGGLANLYPEYCAAYMAAINAGDAAELRFQQRRIDTLMKLYSIGTPFVPILKKAMVMRGVAMPEHSLPPLLPATPDQVEQIRALLDAVEAM